MDALNFAVKLFNKSPLKQQKFKYIKELLPDLTNKNCLDLGSDNGVISYLFRQLGGIWHSGDLTDLTVNSITELVNTNVVKINPEKIDYPDDFFDVIVIVDMLEHVNNDQKFILEIKRILKDNGELIINVPNPKNGLTRKLKYLLGQTDENHGHLRAGYSIQDLNNLLNLKLISFKDYLRDLADFTDCIINFALGILKKDTQSSKGTVVTKNDLGKLKKSFKLFSIIYPFLAVLVWIDQKITFLKGNMLVAKYKK